MVNPRRIPMFLLVALVGTLSALLAVPAAEADDGDYYAAIAFSEGTGSYGFAYGHSSRASAERAALRECSGYDARVVVWAKNAWLVLALGHKRGAHGWAWSSTPSQAWERAIANCSKHTSGAHVSVCIYTNHDVLPDPPYWCRQKDGPATVVVDVPSRNTKLRLGDVESNSGGLRRYLKTESLYAQRKYTFTLTATVPVTQPNGKTAEETVQIDVHVTAGLQTNIDVAARAKRMAEQLAGYEAKLGPPPERAPSIEPLPLFPP